MKKREQAVGAGAATTRAGECHFQAALPESKQISLLKRRCRSPSRLSLEAALPQSKQIVPWSGSAAVRAESLWLSDHRFKRIEAQPRGGV